MAAKEPDFNNKDVLSRLIKEPELGPKGKPSPGAFMLEANEDHLSVNCTLTEDIEDIKHYYKEQLQRGKSPVRISFHKVEEYLRVFRQQGRGALIDDEELGRCFVDTDGKNKKPFKHRPVVKKLDWLPSLSHSGAEFVRTMDEIRSRAFARKMANKKYKVFE